MVRLLFSIWRKRKRNECLLTVSDTGFFISAVVFYVLNKLFPVEGYGKQDEMDVYGAFTASQAAKLGIVPVDGAIEGKEAGEETNKAQESLEKSG